MLDFVPAADFFASVKETERVYLLLRHSIRRHITEQDSDKGAHVGLTEEGRAKAFAFGKLFPLAGDAVYFSSPVGRCVDTAKCIAAGRASVGGPDARKIGAVEVCEVIPDKLLGDYYVKNYEAYMEALNERFYQNICAWMDSDNHPAFFPFHERAEEFHRYMFEKGNAQFNIFVTHDVWVVPTLVHFCGFKFTPSHWMNYLTGIAFVVDEGNSCRERSERIVPVTGLDNGYLCFG